VTSNHPSKTDAYLNRPLTLRISCILREKTQDLVPTRMKSGPRRLTQWTTQASSFLKYQTARMLRSGMINLVLVITQMFSPRPQPAMSVQWTVLWVILNLVRAQMDARIWIHLWAQQCEETFGSMSSMLLSQIRLIRKTRLLTITLTRKRKVMTLRVVFCRRRLFKLLLINRRSVIAISWQRQRIQAQEHILISTTRTIQVFAKVLLKSAKTAPLLRVKESKLAFLDQTRLAKRTAGLT